MIEIERNSPAGNCLADAFADPDTYRVRIDVRADGVAVKRNEGMWSATLSIHVRMRAQLSDDHIRTLEAIRESDG